MSSEQLIKKTSTFGKCGNCNAETDQGEWYEFYYGKYLDTSTRYSSYGPSGPNNRIKYTNTTTSYQIAGSQKVYFCYKCMALEEIKWKKKDRQSLWFFAILLFVVGVIFSIFLLLNPPKSTDTISNIILVIGVCGVAPIFLGVGLGFVALYLNNNYSVQIRAIENNNHTVDPRKYRWDKDKGDQQAIENKKNTLQAQGYDAYFTRSRYLLLKKT